MKTFSEKKEEKPFLFGEREGEVTPDAKGGMWPALLMYLTGGEGRRRTIFRKKKRLKKTVKEKKGDTSVRDLTPPCARKKGGGRGIEIHICEKKETARRKKRKRTKIPGGVSPLPSERRKKGKKKEKKKKWFLEGGGETNTAKKEGVLSTDAISFGMTEGGKGKKKGKTIRLFQNQKLGKEGKRKPNDLRRKKKREGTGRDEALEANVFSQEGGEKRRKKGGVPLTR